MLIAIAQGIGEKMLHDQSVAACQANLRDLVQAVHRYTDDQDGRMPNAVDNTLPRWRWWTDEVFPYVDDVRQFYCPEKAPDMYSISGTSPLLPVIWDHSLLSYGMNYRLGTAHGREPELKRSAIDQPDRFIVLAESNHYLVRTHPSMWFQDIAPRHMGAVNVAFLDGRVELFPLSEQQSPRNGGSGVYDLNQWQIYTR